MAWEKRGARKGKRRLPESQRRRIINRDRRQGRRCWFAYPGICLGISQKLVEVHHVVDAEDGGTDDDYNLATACKPCHVHYSAQKSQQRAVRAAWDWKRRPEKHPGVLD